MGRASSSSSRVENKPNPKHFEGKKKTRKNLSAAEHFKTKGKKRIHIVRVRPILTVRVLLTFFCKIGENSDPFYQNSSSDNPSSHHFSDFDDERV
jgi:hypothetical protein